MEYQLSALCAQGILRWMPWVGIVHDNKQNKPPHNKVTRTT